MSTARWLRSKGLTTKSAAPSFIARTASETSECAVIMMTGAVHPSTFIRLSNWMPFTLPR